MGKTTEDRERDFWDHHVPSLNECLQQYHAGPGPGVLAMMSAALQGQHCRVIDFACGAGVTSAWLAARGHDVVGVELSPASVRRARELCDHLGLKAEFREIDLGEPLAAGESFDAMVGRFALHHLDLDVYAPLLAEVLAPGGHAAFIETMALNPVLTFARSHLTGRAFIPKLGTPDEHPLTRDDVATMGRAFGAAALEVPDVWLVRMANAYILRRRSNRANRWSKSLDQYLGRYRFGRSMSYRQMVVCTKRPSA